MPLYLARWRYLPAAIKAMVEDPQDRRRPTADLAESLGAKTIGFWFAFGEFDGIALTEAPDNATNLAITMAAAGGGAISNLETTVLLDMDEAQEAMHKAAQATYRPPSKV
jgi:uncharacterized protein with GYD domain